MEPFQLKDYDIYNAILQITEQIHGEFGVAAIRNGLSGKTYFCYILYLKLIVNF